MKIKIILAAILIIHAVLLTKLIFFPYPEFFVYPYLTNNGLKPYSQILDQHFPGLMFLPINFDNLGMNTPDIARAWLITIVLITHVLLFFVSREVLKSDKKALLVNLLYLVWQPYFEGWVLWIDNFLPLILLPAFYFTYKFVIEKKQKYLLFIGLLFGIGVVFKQVLVPFAGIVFLYLLWNQKKVKTALTLSLGFLPPVILMLFYLWNIGVLADFWYWTVTYNLTVFADYGRKYPFFSGAVRVGFLLLLSASIVLSKNKKLVQTVLLFILGSLIAIYARFDFVHFQPALPFVLMAIVIGFLAIKEKFGRNLFLLILVGFLLVTAWWLSIFYKGHLSNKVFFFGEDIKAIASKIEKNTNPGEKIFIFGTVPHLYQITKTMPAGDMFIFQFPWFVKATEDRILEGIRRDQPNIVVSDRTVEIEGQKITDFAPNLDKYIQENYHEIDSVGSNKILRRITP